MPTTKLERLPALATELAKLKCDILFGGGPDANLAALTQSSRDTPIVFVAVDFDPVATGDVASLARPGGRLTGVTALESELPAKRVELLKELSPNVSKVAVFANEQTWPGAARPRRSPRHRGRILWPLRNAFTYLQPRFE
jgi:putative tryptophan/tyrosine transport system substrate-binding protein